MCTASIYDARNNLSALIKTAENGEPVQLTRHDKPVAVILSWEDFTQQNVSNNFLERLEITRRLFADVLADPEFNGLEIPKRQPIDENYKKRINSIWEE